MDQELLQERLDAKKAMEEAKAKLDTAEEALKLWKQKNPEFSLTDQMFLYLQKEVERKGKDVESCRQTYNGLIQTYNELVKYIPGSVAQLTSLRVASAPPWIIDMALETLFETSSTVISSITQIEFKERLREFYAVKSKSNKVRCVLLNKFLPPSIVISAHLFPKKKGKFLKPILGLNEINDVKNGLPLFKAIEHAYDRWKLILVANGGRIKMLILDPKLKDTTFFDYMSEFSKEKLAYLPDHLKQERFGSYDQKDLVFTSDARPYKRCLNFHAVVAQQFALREGWIKNAVVAREDLDWSAENLSLGTEAVKNWLESITVGDGIDDSQNLNISSELIEGHEINSSNSF